MSNLYKRFYAGMPVNGHLESKTPHCEMTGADRGFIISKLVKITYIKVTLIYDLAPLRRPSQTSIGINTDIIGIRTIKVVERYSNIVYAQKTHVLVIVNLVYDQ